MELASDYLPNLLIDSQIGIGYDFTLHAEAQAHQLYPVILNRRGQYKMLAFEWGVIADYMDTPEKIAELRPSMCNARVEKMISDGKSIWHKIRQYRCLIPVTGFFEHRKIKEWKKRVPYHISLKGRTLFCLPGLFYPTKRIVAGKETIVGTYTILTRAAIKNMVMRNIHNDGENCHRMALMLPKELEKRWLDPKLSFEEMNEIAAFEMPEEELDYHTVYTIRTDKPRPDGLSKVDPYEWAGLPPLGIDSIAYQMF